MSQDANGNEIPYLHEDGKLYSDEQEDSLEDLLASFDSYLKEAELREKKALEEIRGISERLLAVQTDGFEFFITLRDLERVKDGETVNLYQLKGTGWVWTPNTLKIEEE